MTAFNFVIFGDMATVATDTLNTAGPEQRPYLFSTKIHILTHLHAVLGGKGRGLFLEDCYRVMSIGLIARDIADANEMVPDMYRELWAEQLAREDGDTNPDAQPPSATVYHIGWVEAEGRMAAFEYSSADNFNGTRLKDGAWLHPNTVDELIQDPFDLVKITIMQKEIDDKLPNGKRAGIGGDIYLYQLTPDAIIAQRAHRCGDYDKQYREMEEYSKESERNHDQI